MAIKWCNYLFAPWSVTYGPVPPGAGGDWPENGGTYVFAQRTPSGWIAKYVGQADSLRARLSRHDKWLAAEQLGATEVHIRDEENEVFRTGVEALLIHHYRPPLNEHVPPYPATNQLPPPDVPVEVPLTTPRPPANFRLPSLFPAAFPPKK